MHLFRLRSIRPPALALTLALGATAVSIAGEGDVSPDVLDELERTICIGDQNWTNSLQEHARQQQVSVEALAGQNISDPRRREYLQQKLDAMLTASQKELIAWHRRQLEKSQHEHRRLVGHEFDLSLCGQTDRRMKRRDAWEAQADRLAGSDTSMVSAACRELAVMKGPPPEARSSFKESDIQYWQARATENYERLSRSYEARTGKRFDPSRCPK